MHKTTTLMALGLLSVGLNAQAAISNNSQLFEVGVDDVLAEINAAIPSIETPMECTDNFNRLYQVLYNFNSKDVNLPSLTDEKLISLTQESFQTRLNIKEGLKSLNYSDPYGNACLTSTKEIVKALRYVEDYFIEYSYKRSGRDREEYVTFEGEGIHFLKAPGVEFNSSEDLEKGDILISRGNAYTSAAIARIGQDDYQFSHLTLVHREADNSLHTSEAHIEIGNVVAPMQVHIDQKNARTVLFRHKNKELAHAASDYTYNLIADHKKNRGFNIEYDFGMRLDSDLRLFCTEVAYVGYLQASKDLYNKEMHIPQYLTKFDRGHLRFLKQVGIAVNDENIDDFETFGPGDMQFDSRFEMLAEWRNPTKLQDTRFKDAILTKLFEWMDEKNYYFKTSFADKLKNSFAWLMRRNKWTSNLMGLSEKFPLNMRVKQIHIFVTLDKAGEALYEVLKAAQAKSETPLTFKELYDILEEFREKDLKQFLKKRKKSTLHKHFRPTRKFMKAELKSFN